MTNSLIFGMFMVLAFITPAFADVYNITFDHNFFVQKAALTPSNDDWTEGTTAGLIGELTTTINATVEVYANGSALPLQYFIHSTPLPVTTAIHLIAFRWEQAGLFDVVLGDVDDEIIMSTGSEYSSAVESGYLAVYTVKDFPASTSSISFRNQGTPGFPYFLFESVVYTIVGTTCAVDFAAMPNACGGPVFEPAGAAIPFPTSSAGMLIARTTTTPTVLTMTTDATVSTISLHSAFIGGAVVFVSFAALFMYCFWRPLRRSTGAFGTEPKIFELENSKDPAAWAWNSNINHPETIDVVLHKPTHKQHFTTLYVGETEKPSVY